MSSAPPPAETTLPLSLLRLVSASLPVGGFAYSRGLEAAVAAGWVGNAEGVRHWVFGVLRHSYAALDGALFLRMMAALAKGDSAGFRRLDDWAAAARESRELQEEDRRMAEALMSLLAALTPGATTIPCQSYPAAFAQAAFEARVAPEPALAGLMWAVCDAQVAAAIRLGVIGQVEGQRILSDAPAVISACVDRARSLEEAEIGNVSVMLAIGSAQHERQHSRLFRS